MRTSTVFATLAATAAATPVAIRAAADYQWAVTEWDAGCNNAGCDYTFRIAGPAATDYPARPAFAATCSGKSVDSKVFTSYAGCQMDAGIKGSLVSKINEPAELLGSRTVVPLQVSFQFADPSQDNTYWNYTGVQNTTFNRGGSPPQSFAIIPKESFGIA
ncbi:hypothetical protein PG996_000156 [Apiospora saccharicola]|uniref:Uncharacterized protein n=1 Tax=Apiospora saccharicola TaxID=335842 RepID=A0ABR1WCZ3_9PEZI